MRPNHVGDFDAAAPGSAILTGFPRMYMPTVCLLLLLLGRSIRRFSHSMLKPKDGPEWENSLHKQQQREPLTSMR